MENLNTYFINVDGEVIGSLIGLVSVSVGTVVKIKNVEHKVESVKLVLEDDSNSNPMLGFSVYCN